MKNKKSLLSSFIYNSIFTTLNIIFPLITLPYASRVIGAAGIGKVNFSNSIANYFLIIASLGIPLYGIREVAKIRDNSEKLSKIFTEIFLINSISTIISIILYYVMILNVNYFSNNKLLFIVSGFSIFLNIANIDWLYQGLEEYKYIALRSIIFKVISLICLFTFVKTKDDYITYALINILAIGGNNIINIINIRKFTSFSFKNLEFNKHIKPITTLLSIQLAVNIYINLDTTMLGILSGDDKVGYYTSASRVNKIIVTVITSVSTILLPRLSYYIEKNNMDEFKRIINKAIKVLILLNIPAMIGTIFLSNEIITVLFGKEFMPSIMTMRIMSPLIIILSIGNLFGQQILMTIGRENELLKSVVIGAIINFTFNFILIPNMNQNGAAISTVIAEFFVMLVQVKIALKYIKVKIDKNFIINIIRANIMMMIVLIIISINVHDSIIKMISSIIFGGMMYLIVNIVHKDETSLYVLSKLKKH